LPRGLQGCSGTKVPRTGILTAKGKAGVFNGTVGVVTGMSLQEQALTVLTDDDEQVGYDFAELDELAARLRRHHPPLPRQRVPRGGHPAHHLVLDDAG
jgi:hypothetical protein